MYGYGYDLTFTKNKHSHAIFICKLKKSPLPRFPYRVSFETNQLRTISLRAEYDFTNVDSLKRYLFVVDDVILFLCDADKKEIFYLSNLGEEIGLLFQLADDFLDIKISQNSWIGASRDIEPDEEITWKYTLYEIV